jgi:hypothetical protein
MKLTLNPPDRFDELIAHFKEDQPEVIVFRSPTVSRVHLATPEENWDRIRRVVEANLRSLHEEENLRAGSPVAIESYSSNNSPQRQFRTVKIVQLSIGIPG